MTADARRSACGAFAPTTPTRRVKSSLYNHHETIRQSALCITKIIRVRTGSEPQPLSKRMECGGVSAVQVQPAAPMDQPGQPARPPVQPAEVPPAAGRPGGHRHVRRRLQPPGRRLAGRPRRPARRRPHHPRNPLPPLPRLFLLQRHRLRRVARGHRPHPRPRRPPRQEGEGQPLGRRAPAAGHGAGPAQPHGRVRRRHLPGQGLHHLLRGAGGCRLPLRRRYQDDGLVVPRQQIRLRLRLRRHNVLRPQLQLQLRWRDDVQS
ncbi:hypothetical protein ACQJBY_057476 [Aegilops geniculata]